MLRRIILGAIVVASFIWIGFSIFQGYQQGGGISIESVFNQNDESIVVINRVDEFSPELVSRFDNFKSAEWLRFASNPAIEQATFSKNQNKVLFRFKKNISPNQLSNIFGDSIQFEMGKITSIKGKKAWINQDLLLISTEQEERKKQDFYFDSKATASHIKFIDGNIQVTDIYLKPEGKIEYIYSMNEHSGTKINDAEYFAYAIPNSIQSYWFEEKNFALQNKDTVFTNGPMAKWLNTGYVTMDFMNSKVILTDYSDGNDPLFILENIENTSDTNWFSTPLHLEFPQGNKYVVKALEDFMVISENENACDQFIANYKLGKTLALSSSGLERIYGNLPKLVSERLVSPNEKWSNSTYNGKLLTTVLENGNKIQIEKTQEEISLPVNFAIQDFVTLKGLGNVVVVGSNGEIATFINQKLAWSKKIDKIKSLEIIDFLDNGKQQILVSTDMQIHLFDKEGNNINGFPISTDNSIITPPKFYRWKGAPFVLVGTENNEIIQFDSRGRERFAWNCKSKIEKPISVWASQSKLFWGVQTGSELLMFNVKNQKEHRRFSLESNALALKIPNELIHFQFDGNQLQRVDQKGAVLNLQKITSGKLLNQNDNKNIIVKKQNEVNAFNSQGIPFCQFRIPFNEFEKVTSFQRSNGQTIFSVIDELENNIYIYNDKGAQLFEKTFEGKLKVILTESNEKLIVTTIVGSFVVQYFLN